MKKYVPKCFTDLLNLKLLIEKSNATIVKTNPALRCLIAEQFENDGCQLINHNKFEKLYIRHGVTYLDHWTFFRKYVYHSLRTHHMTPGMRNTVTMSGPLTWRTHTTPQLTHQKRANAGSDPVRHEVRGTVRLTPAAAPTGQQRSPAHSGYFGRASLASQGDKFSILAIKMVSIDWKMSMEHKYYINLAI